MVKFAEFLQPTLDVSAMPPEALSRERHDALQTVHGRGADGWSDLLAARRAELFRWLSAAK